MPLLYSLNSNSYEDFFDTELEKILSKYSFFVSKSTKTGCLNSEYICTILKQEGITVKWFRLVGSFHFISCIIRDNIRYYIDNETKSGFGVVYLRIDGDSINETELENQDLPILKQFYNSEQYTLFKQKKDDLRYGEDMPDIIKTFISVDTFISPHYIVDLRSNGNCNNSTHPIPSLESEIHAGDGKYITIDASLIDRHEYESSPVISFDEYKCFTLSPRYNEVFNQFNTYMTEELTESTRRKITDLLKLCLLIPDFKLQTYKSTSVKGYYSRDCARELKGGSRKKINKRKINKRNSKNSKRNLKRNSKNSKRNLKRNSKRNSKNSKRKH
jgi:hypothetical protein